MTHLQRMKEASTEQSEEAATAFLTKPVMPSSLLGKVQLRQRVTQVAKSPDPRTPERTKHTEIGEKRHTPPRGTPQPAKKAGVEIAIDEEDDDLIPRVDLSSPPKTPRRPEDAEEGDQREMEASNAVGGHVPPLAAGQRVEADAHFRAVQPNQV